MALPPSIEEKSLNKREGPSFFLSTINEKIAELVKTAKADSNSPLRVSFSDSTIDLKDTLEYLDSFPFFYWEGKSQKRECFLAIGINSLIKDLSSLDSSRVQRPYYILGGQPTTLTHEDQYLWSEFAKSPYFVPNLVVSQKDNLFTIEVACQETIKFSKKIATKPAKIINQKNIPPLSKWTDTIQEIHSDLQEECYNKIVLSRKKKLLLEGYTLLSFTQKLKSQKNSYNLLWALTAEHFFISQSPETLFKKEKNTIIVDSLAGTIKRGQNLEQDSIEKEKLLKSEKDLHEHRIVTDFILEHLKSLCSNFEYLKKESITPLVHVQHLHTELKGVLKKDISETTIISSLHPTPAVGGAPQKGIQKQIAKKESFDRGLFTAPIGFITPEKSEFLIAIRSALFYKNDLHIYAGAGIVKGSDPIKEWDETERKMKTIVGLL